MNAVFILKVLLLMSVQRKVRLVAEMGDIATLRCAAPFRMPAQLKLRK